MVVKIPVNPIAEISGQHYSQYAAPDSGIGVTRCGRMISYERSDLIVSWDEKPATCKDCVRIYLKAIAKGVK